jgi:hypothetical protein
MNDQIEQLQGLLIQQCTNNKDEEDDDKLKEIQQLTKQIKKKYQKQYQLQLNKEEEYRKKYEVLNEYTFQANYIKAQLDNFVGSNNNNNNNSNVTSEEDDDEEIINTILQCEDIELRNFMENIYDNFATVYKSKEEIENDNVKKPSAIQIRQSPNVLLKYWYKILSISCNKNQNSINIDDNNSIVCTDVNEIIINNNINNTTNKTGINNGNKNTYYEDNILSFNTLCNNLNINIQVKIEYNDFEYISINSDPFLPKLDYHLSKLMMSNDMDIIEFIKNDIWPLIEKRSSLRRGEGGSE